MVCIRDWATDWICMWAEDLRAVVLTGVDLVTAAVVVVIVVLFMTLLLEGQAPLSWD